MVRGAKGWVAWEGQNGVESVGSVPDVEEEFEGCFVYMKKKEEEMSRAERYLLMKKDRENLMSVIESKWRGSVSGKLVKSVYLVVAESDQIIDGDIVPFDLGNDWESLKEDSVLEIDFFDERDKEISELKEKVGGNGR